MTKPARFILKATCTIKGSSLDGIEANLWYGKTRAAAERVATLKKAALGSYYRDWRVVDANAELASV